MSSVGSFFSYVNDERPQEPKEEEAFAAAHDNDKYSLLILMWNVASNDTVLGTLQTKCTGI